MGWPKGVPRKPKTETPAIEEKPKRKYTKRAESIRKPVLVEVIYASGERMQVEGYEYKYIDGFLEIVTGYGEVERIGLTHVAHLHIQGTQLEKPNIPQLSLRDSTGIGVNANPIPEGPRVYDARGPFRDAKAPRAKMLDPMKTQGPASVVENPDGTVETVGAAMVTGI